MIAFRLTVSAMATVILFGFAGRSNADDIETINVWPDKPPGETKELPPEADQTKPDDRLIAGRRIIKLGNVSTPQIAVFRPAPEKANGTAIVICPGGGHYILAYDLEGTEVAEWLTSLGVTAIVLKYRVPFRDPDKRWRAAVQDAQRAMSLVRSRAKDWNIAPDRIGICGFSAGGETAALTSIFADRQYKAVDAVDRISSRPDFAMLIYPGGLTERGQPSLREYINVPENVPPMFFAHAFDDRVSVHNSLALASAVKEAGGSAELHIYSSGGHGYGLRETEEPVTRWPDRAAEWLSGRGFLPEPETSARADAPDLQDIESQPLLASVERLIEAMDDIGSPIPRPVVAELNELSAGDDSELVAKRVQELPGPFCLAGVSLQDNGPLRVVSGPADGEHEQADGKAACDHARRVLERLITEARNELNNDR